MTSTAGLGGLNSVYVTIEDTYGTYEDPADGSGAWVPILSESLVYTESKYYSPQIRETTIVSDAKQSFYHIEGDIEMEVDATFLPYFLYGSRHTIVKTGSGPYTYVATPSNLGSTYPGGASPGLSITVVRNGNGFGYAGCVVGQYAFTIDAGILKVTMSILGLSEQLPADLDTTSWIAPQIFGADASTIYIDAAGTAPTFASAVQNFNGFTGTLNYNAAAQNRITPTRSATFISYGETEATYETELDFLDRTDYNHMVANDKRAIRLESVIPAGTFAGATKGFRLDFNNSVFDTYEVDTPGMGDLVTANATGRALGIAGGSPYQIVCKSPTNIT